MLSRVYLDQLKSPDDAVRVAKESASTEGAKMVARYMYIQIHVHVPILKHNTVHSQIPLTCAVRNNYMYVK